MSAMKLSSIQKKEKVSDQVLARIKESLMKGDLKLGDRLPGVCELANKMEVSISSVREAIKMLESLGAVEMRQGEGTFVCAELREGIVNAPAIQLMLLPQSAKYLVEFREMYETMYTYLAMENATSQDLLCVEGHVVTLEKKARQLSPHSLVDAQDEILFHSSVLHCTHNPYVITIGQSSLELFFDVMNKRLAPLKSRDAARDHRNIYEALQMKDARRLEQVLQKIFQEWNARFAPSSKQ